MRSAAPRSAIRVPRLETCEHCEGSGAEPGSSVSTCATCNGRGEVRQVQQSVFGRFVNVSTCPRCGGSGRSIDKPCTKCRGEGRERTERESRSSSRRASTTASSCASQGQGEAGMRGGPHGDLYVLIRLKEHRAFRRDGDDLVHVLRDLACAGRARRRSSGPDDRRRAGHGEDPGRRAARSDGPAAWEGRAASRLVGRGDQLVYLDVASRARSPRSSGSSTGS